MLLAGIAGFHPGGTVAIRPALADVIERRRQIEPGEHAVLEARDGGDPIAGE